MTNVDWIGSSTVCGKERLTYDLEDTLHKAVHFGVRTVCGGVAISLYPFSGESNLLSPPSLFLNSNRCESVGR